MKTDSIFPGTLYHGTDKIIFLSSNEERVFRSEICSDILNFLYPRFLKDGMSVSKLSAYKAKRGDLIGSDWKTFIDCFQKWDSHMRGSQLYQYDSFYLTNSEERGESFARLSWVYGEKGHIALVFYRNALKIWNIKQDADKDILRKMDAFEEFCQYHPEPIILVFENVPEFCLLRENGTIIDWKTMESTLSSSRSGINFRCVPDFSASKYLSSVIDLN